ncbi:MAG: hypothetical protein IPM60_11145 [Rhodospirillales bacterium]|nr:hypothetical protein [Rhodospirillales bacterium]
MNEDRDDHGNRYGLPALGDRRWHQDRRNDDRRQGEDRRGRGRTPIAAEDRQGQLVTVRPYAFRSFDERRIAGDRRGRDHRAASDAWADPGFDGGAVILTAAEVRALLAPPEDDD